MTDLRTAAQQALEALCLWATGRDMDAVALNDLILRLEAALAEPVLQTCNCRWNGEVQVQQCTLHEAHVDAIHEWAERAKTAEKKLAALAEPVQEPVAGRLLTDDEIQTEWSQTPQDEKAEGLWFGRRIEGLVRSMVQEPVAQRWVDAAQVVLNQVDALPHEMRRYVTGAGMLRSLIEGDETALEPVQEPCNKSCAPGYCYCAAQKPQRKPLSKEDIERITYESPDFVAFVRAVEEAHGIGKQE